MNKFKTYCAVILYLAINSVYAERGSESTVTHMLSPLSVMLCGFVEPTKTELEKFIEVSEEMNCSSKEDIQDHCSCIKKISGKPLSTPMKNKFLAEFGFLVKNTDAGHSKNLRDLANFNSLLGAYGGSVPNSPALNPQFFSCLNENVLDEIEGKLKSDFKESANTKVGVPALYRGDYLEQVKSSNKLKLMDNASREADATLVKDIADYIAKKEGVSALDAKFVLGSPYINLVENEESSILLNGTAVTLSGSYRNKQSTVSDLKRAELALEFFKESPLAGLKYSNSPLYKVYNQTYDRSKADISDYLGRLATKSGLVDSAKSGMGTLSSSTVDAVKEASMGLPIATFLMGECIRIKEEIKKSVSSNYIPNNDSPMLEKSQYYPTMSYDNIYGAQESARFKLDLLESFDPNTIDGNTNLLSLEFFRKKFKERYKENLSVFDEETAEYMLKTKDFNFSQLICSKIEVDKKVNEIVASIENSGDSEELLEKVLETKFEVGLIETQLNKNRVEVASLENEKTNLLADNVALESRKKVASKKLKKASQTKGSRRLDLTRVAKSSLENISSSIDLNNGRLSEIDAEVSNLRATNDSLSSKQDVIKEKIMLPKIFTEAPIHFLSLDSIISQSEKEASDKFIRDSFLNLEVDSFVVESANGSGDPVEKAMFTGKKDTIKSKVTSQNIESGEFETITYLEETKRVLAADSDRVSTQILGVLDNKAKLTTSEASGITSVVAQDAEKIVDLIQEQKGRVTEEGTPALEEIKTEITKAVNVNIAADEVVSNDKGIQEMLASVSSERPAHLDEVNEGNQIEGNNVKLDQNGSKVVINFLKENELDHLASQGASLINAGINSAEALTSFAGQREIFTGARDESVEASKSSQGLSEGIPSRFTTGSIDTIGDLEQLGEGLAEATLKKLEERGIDVSGLTPASTSSSNYFERAKEAKELEASSRAVRKEVANKKGKLKGMQVGNIGLSKKIAQERRAVNKIKDYSGASSKAIGSNGLASSKKYAPEEKLVEPTQSKVGQSGKEDELVSKTASIAENKNINQEVLNGVKPESNKLAEDIKRELRKTKAVKQAVPRKVAKGKSSLGTGRGQKASSISTGGGGVSASSPSSAQVSDRAPSSFEASKKAITPVKINFNNKALAFDEKAYDVSTVIEGVDSGLYVRLPNFDTPKDFLEFSVKKRNKWIEEQFKSSKALEAIIVLPDGQKVLVKKKD